MSENLDHSEEIARLEARLKAWEARSGKLYEGLKFKDWKDAQITKKRVYSEYMSEYNEIKSRLEELKPTPHNSQKEKTKFSEAFLALTIYAIIIGAVGLFIYGAYTGKLWGDGINRKCYDYVAPNGDFANTCDDIFTVP